MFSSALKSFSSNITSNYTLSPNPTSASGPWKIYDAKKKSTGRTVSVFVFDRRSLDPHSGLGRSGGPSLRKVQDEAVERLKKEASSLARLRHPCVLELVEPVEETRNGGLMFATEQVTSSLGTLLAEQDEQGRPSGVASRSSRYNDKEVNGPETAGKGMEIDELDIQKGLSQLGKALEFLHESAGLVHANLTPEAIFVNAKSDWKLSGLGFSGPAENSKIPSSAQPISLSEILHHDPRLPRSVQLNLDYASPDFVFDSNVTPAADLFSLGLLIVALYNPSHESPLQSTSSISTYKRLFNSSSSTPTQNNNFLSSAPLPKDLLSTVLPRLITRRPVDRLTAKEFQQSQYFDNILVSAIRFLESFPAKSPSEKSQFMRGLMKVLPQFPKSVLDKKILPALLEEMKDRDLLSLVLQNVFSIVKLMPAGRATFTEKVIPRLREVYLSGATSNAANAANAGAQSRDIGKEAGLVVTLDNMDLITRSCSVKDFKDDILPLFKLGVESSTHSLVDKSLRSLPLILPVLDFPTLKNDLFPVVASVFTKTNSLGIKVRGLEAFVILCGGSTEPESEALGDDLNGVVSNGNTDHKKVSGNAVLDKYTMQEKVVPLLSAIKTKEPAVMMAALRVFQQIGKHADAEFVATVILPALWAMSLGPLLNLQQFKAFTHLIRSLSSRVEREQTRKLQELSNPSDSSKSGRTEDFMSFGTEANAPGGINGSGEAMEDDFERLVLGRGTGGGSSATSRPQPSRTQSKPDNAPMFSWSTPHPGTPVTVPANTSSTIPAMNPQQSSPYRTITPDLSNFAALQPSSSSMGFSTQPLHPQPHSASSASYQKPTQNPWAASSQSSSTAPPTPYNPPRTNQGQRNPPSAFAIPPPPLSSASSYHAPPLVKSNPAFHVPLPATTSGPKPKPTGSQGGLDKYESLL
ncbi:MAG: hypothetical protein M1817_006896 [Caeruleum heppii]|nr:MAG: hypothetical protein M1817_006896 [Caeruleum heppii]